MTPEEALAAQLGCLSMLVATVAALYFHGRNGRPPAKQKTKARRPRRPKAKHLRPETVAAVRCLTATPEGQAELRRRKIKQGDLAHRLGRSDSAISKIKTSWTYPHWPALADPIKALEVLGYGER